MSFNPTNLSTYSDLSYIDRIKLLMLVAMTVGHLAWAFVPTDSMLSEALHFFARMTIPLACFLVVEGYRLTKDVWGYVRRLFLFGVVSQVPFAFFVFGLFGEYGLLANPVNLISYGNVLFTLGFGLLSVMTLDKLRHAHIVQKFTYLIPLILFATLAMWSDWGMLVVFWVGAIFWGGALGFLMMTVGLFALSFLVQDTPMLSYIFSLKPQSLMDYGIFMSVPIMFWYQTQRHRSPTHYRLPRLLFYWYYVGHLVVIGVLQLLILPNF